jgi:hypothetical protein
MNPFGVVSFDPNRVWIERGGAVIAKYTKYQEVTQLILARDQLDHARSFLWKNKCFSIKVPEVLSWDDNDCLLRQSYCAGENLEMLLRSRFTKNRIVWVNLARDLLRWMKDEGFFWQGLAPRHVLVDQRRRVLSLIDFERPLFRSSGGFSEEEFKGLLRGAVHEELCAFLFREEQEEVFPCLWNQLPKGFLRLSEISSSRQKLLIHALFGDCGDFVSQDQLATAQKFLADIVTPFYIGRSPFFPLVHLDHIRGAENYVKTIIKIAEQDRETWPEILGARTQT